MKAARARRWAVTTLLLTTCAAESELTPDTEVYRLALASVREQLNHNGPIEIHPLLVLRPPAEPSDDRPTWEFNTADTASGAGILKAAGPGYRRCTPTPAGSCDGSDGEVSIILSEATEFGSNGVVIYVLVTDGRAGHHPRTTFMVRLKRMIGGWSVVESRSQPRPQVGDRGRASRRGWPRERPARHPDIATLAGWSNRPCRSEGAMPG